jgi:hypothetical protein
MFSTMFFLNKGVVSWLPFSPRQTLSKQRGTAMKNSVTNIPNYPVSRFKSAHFLAV